MRPGFLILAMFLVAADGTAQVVVTGPGVVQPGQASRPSDANYGPPRVVELDAIAISDAYQRSHVITEGEVSPFQAGQYWTLGRGGSRVLLIPGRDFDPSELDLVVGRRIEVRGIIRLIREKQYVRGTDLDLIEDPILPPLPPPMFEQGWPRISITAFEIRDRSNGGADRVREIEGGVARQILDDPTSHLGKKVRVYGQFRGRNLFGDLPANSARGKDDWVLKDGDTAMWVLGKEPRGKGWKLDLDYKGDARKWLEVEGKPEVMNGVVYLKAGKVEMSKAPPDDEPEPDRP